MSEQPIWRDLADELWRRTETDWHVSVRHILTEPVCPVVDLWPEDKTLPSVSGIAGDTIDEAIKAACEMVLAKLPAPAPPPQETQT